jgi:predicted Zn finger-like uncharacterized protein
MVYLCQCLRHLFLFFVLLQNVMEISCEKCQARYRLAPHLLGGAGRMVRCTRCSHVWFHALPMDDLPQIHDPADLPTESDFDSSAESFQQMLEGSDSDFDSVPPALHSDDIAAHMAVIDDRPGGLSAGAFGLCTFLLLLFATLAGGFLFRDAVVRHFPPMLAVYKPLGFEVKAPGEGLRLSELITRTRDLADGKKVLDMSMKLTNMTDAVKFYPSLRVTLFGPYGAALKHWDFHPQEAELASGESIPVQVSFENAPVDGARADVRVISP